MLFLMGSQPEDRGAAPFGARHFLIATDKFFWVQNRAVYTAVYTIRRKLGESGWVTFCRIRYFH